MQRKAEPEPLAGIRQHRCEQYIYLKLNYGETAREQRKAVFAHWKEMAKAVGGLSAGVRDQTCMITLPTGEVFCDFCVVKFPGLVTETEEQMIPRVQQGGRIFRDFATATARCTATIEDESTLVCGDGRRISLASCTWRPLNAADFVAVKRKPKRVS